MTTPLEIIRDEKFNRYDEHVGYYVSTYLAINLLKSLRAEVEGKKINEDFVSIGNMDFHVEDLFADGHNKAIQEQIDSYDALIKELTKKVLWEKQ